MEIVVLDGYALNPGDLSWEGLSKLGRLEVYDRTPPDKIVERAERADAIFTNKTPLTAETLKRLPRLRYIGVLATGYNVVDTAFARSKGIVSSNVPTYGTNSVAQSSFALLLELCHHAGGHSDAVHSGRWSSAVDWCFWDYPPIELAGKTMSIIGFGRIGRQVAKIADAVGMVVAAHTRTRVDPPPLSDFRWVDLDEAFSDADVLSLHCPLTAETEGIVNRRRLGNMKKTAFIINTSRGPLIQEEDLARALDEGTIAGAGLDVLAAEPPAASNPLLHAKNCLITPHISWATKEARTRLLAVAAENLRAFMTGAAVNVILG